MSVCNCGCARVCTNVFVCPYCVSIVHMCMCNDVLFVQGSGVCLRVCVCVCVWVVRGCMCACVFASEGSKFDNFLTKIPEAASPSFFSAKFFFGGEGRPGGGGDAGHNKAYVYPCVVLHKGNEYTMAKNE